MVTPSTVYRAARPKTLGLSFLPHDIAVNGSLAQPFLAGRFWYSVCMLSPEQFGYTSKPLSSNNPSGSRTHVLNSGAQVDEFSHVEVHQYGGLDARSDAAHPHTVSAHVFNPGRDGGDTHTEGSYKTAARAAIAGRGIESRVASGKKLPKSLYHYNEDAM